MSDRIKHLLSAGTLAAAATLLAPLPCAVADVTVTPAGAIAGQTAVLNFAVSDDRADSSTTRVELHLPQGSFTTTAAQPKAGWQTAAGAGGIVWTAVDPGGVIGPGQFEVFSVELGPLPSGTDHLTFDVAQTYADGQVLNWSDDPGAAHPAPVVQLQPSTTAAAAPATAADPPPAPGPPQALAAPPAAPPGATTATAAPPVAKPDNTRRVAAGLTLGIALILLGVAAAAALQRRRPAETG